MDSLTVYLDLTVFEVCIQYYVLKCSLTCFYFWVATGEVSCRYLVPFILSYLGLSYVLEAPLLQTSKGLRLYASLHEKRWYRSEIRLVMVVGRNRSFLPTPPSCLASESYE